jgi:hypothetical protein
VIPVVGKFWCFGGGVQWFDCVVWLRASVCLTFTEFNGLLFWLL